MLRCWLPEGCHQDPHALLSSSVHRLITIPQIHQAGTKTFRQCNIPVSTEDTTAGPHVTLPPELSDDALYSAYIGCSGGHHCSSSLVAGWPTRDPQGFIIQPPPPIHAFGFSSRTGCNTPSAQRLPSGVAITTLPGFPRRKKTLLYRPSNPRTSICNYYE